MQRKLVLVVVDSLRTDMLLRACEQGRAPTFEKLLDRGELVGDCVSSFPSVTPVCAAEITTGMRPDEHLIPGMNWYHRLERRYVEYGSSLEATRAFGLFRSLYDTVYNMNMGHLSHEVPTLFERLGDAGVRTACTPFLIYRGRRRHELGLEGLMRRAALAAKFHHAVWGPDELFYGELYASQRVPCKPTLARPNTRDPYSACVGRELVERDLYDFMLFSLPDNDYHSHKHGPASTVDSIAVADSAVAEIVSAYGGLDAFLLDNGVIVMADHSQSDVSEPIPLAEGLAQEWSVAQPSADPDQRAELAVGPSARAAAIWVLAEDERREQLTREVRARLLADVSGVELVAWLENEGDAECAVLAREDAELRFRPGGELVDRRGEHWSVDGDPGTLGARIEDGRFQAPGYPDALMRTWSALRNPNAGDLLISASPGYELVDWGGATHIPGGSHGALDAADSLGPLLTVDVDGPRPDREQWRIGDVAGLIYGHFGLDD